MGLDLGANQVDRYSRQLLLDDVGPAGQEALLSASVLVVGAGGLGAPVVQYLAAAGVGTLAIADDDSVERSNLHRQVIHDSDDLGRPKVDSAADFVTALNPDVTVERHPVRIDPDTVTDLVESYDAVVDASDNFPTRFLLNDACVLGDVPLVLGAVSEFTGQVTTITGGRPCYRCLSPEIPPADAVPDCSTAGVLGAVPGTVGTIQATAVLKLLLDESDLRAESDLLDDRLLVYNAREFRTETVRVRPDPACPVCGENPSIESVADADYRT
jgi:adenylyltransferase/sulfurtransferase